MIPTLQYNATLACTYNARMVNRYRVTSIDYDFLLAFRAFSPQLEHETTPQQPRIYPLPQKFVIGSVKISLVTVVVAGGGPKLFTHGS